MAVNVRREPLGRLSLQTGNRLSLAGNAPLKPSVEGRQSIANRRESTTGRPSVATFSRLSLGGNVSARPSVAPSAPSRLSLGGNPPVPAGNRRLSVAVLPKSADPRPIGKKEYTSQCVKSIMQYLATHGFDPNFPAKHLLSPSKSQFIGVMTFLLQQIDPNFLFGPSMEEEFRTCMKYFGYPINIGKSALIPVGSPHTWPSILAALHWLVDYLSYEEELKRSKTEKPEVDILGDQEQEEADLQLFEHNARAYHKFMKGDDEVSTRMDDELVRAFHEKNQRAAENLKKLEAKLEAAKAEKLKLKSPEAEIKKLEQERAHITVETEKLVKFQAAQKEHKTQQAAALEKLRGELEEQRRLRASSADEKKELEGALALQKFSPEEVASMNHKREMLRESLEHLYNQKKSLQEETFAEEKKNKDTRAALDRLAKTFNSCALALELAPVSARHARGIDYTLKLNADKRDVTNLVGMDLTKTLKPALATLQKQLSQEISTAQATLRELGSHLASVTEMREEHQRRVKLLEERVVKKEDAYRDAKEGSEAEFNGSADKIEGMERQVNLMKAAQSRILEESETKIHNLDIELVQQRQMHMAVRDQLVRQIHEMSERVAEHKQLTHQLLRDVVGSVNQQKEMLSRPVFRTPGRSARPDK